MSLALLFSGQGAQKVGMGRTLYENSPGARACYDEANRVLGWDLARISFDGPEAELTLTRVCQPALYVHGMAVHAALQEQGRLGEVSLALGLSLGEITALAAAGVFDFATGLRIVAERGRLMQLACEQTSGSMASIIGEGPEKVAALCREFDLDLANLNCPGQIVVSGDKARVDAAVAAAKERGIRKVISLNVAGAYHSRLMEPARAGFAAYLGGVTIGRPRFPVIANTTARPEVTPDDIRANLVKQVVSPVLWEAGMRAAAAAGITRFFELGPGGVLAGLARRMNREWPVRSLSEFADLAA